MGLRSAACSTRPSPAKVCPRGSVPIMIRCSGSSAGRPICGSWTWKRYKRCPRFPGPIHLSNGSLGPSAGSIWTVCSFGRQMTWFESWSCSKSSTTRRVYTKGYPATRPGRKRAAQPLNPLALRITAGVATATDCLNCQSLLKWQFAMYRSRDGWKFRSLQGNGDDDGEEIKAWVYSPQEASQYISQEPMPVHINLWLFKGLAPKNGQEFEVIIHDFKFKPE